MCARGAPAVAAGEHDGQNVGGHRLLQLALHARGRVVRDSQMAMQRHRRGPLPVPRHQVHAQEPRGERKLRGIENRSRGHRCLSPAAVALLQLSKRQLTASVVAAVRTTETVRPSPLVEGIQALVLVAEPPEKFVFAEVVPEPCRRVSHEECLHESAHFFASLRARLRTPGKSESPEAAQSSYRYRISRL